jgi:hypothetical protein
VEEAQAIAMKMGLPQVVISGIETVVNIAECLRDDLDRHIRGTAEVCPTCLTYSE